MPENLITGQTRYEKKRVASLLDSIGDQPIDQMSFAVKSSGAPPVSGEQSDLNGAMGRLANELPGSVHEASVRDIEQRLSRFNSKAPNSDSGKRLGGEQYKLEKLDPKHRVGFVLSGFLLYYKQHPTSFPFFAWLDSLSASEVRAIMISHVGASGEKLERAIQSFVQGVAYLNAAARVQYAVDCSPNGLVWQGQTFSTEKLSTMASGQGWAIWVMSPSGVFYSNSHTHGTFHHSSFLEGKSVGGAGEWQVVAGKIKIISGKTGHYRCGAEELVKSLRKLSAAGANLMQVKVKVFNGSTPVLLNAWEFMNETKLQKAYKTDADGAEPTGTLPGRNFTLKPKTVKDNPYDVDEES